MVLTAIGATGTAFLHAHHNARAAQDSIAVRILLRQQGERDAAILAEGLPSNEALANKPFPGRGTKRRPVETCSYRNCRD